MRPSHAFAIPSAAPALDARRWLRLMLVALASATALLPLLGAAARAHAASAAPERAFQQAS